MTVRDVVIVGGGWGVSGLKLIAAAVTREIQIASGGADDGRNSGKRVSRNQGCKDAGMRRHQEETQMGEDENQQCGAW